MKTIAFIFARGGSRGLVDKNLKKIGGVSLVGRAVLQAKAVSQIDRVLISTDDQEIADEAVKHGAECLFMRPVELASDKANEWDAWRHAINWLVKNGEYFDLFVSVPATAPLRMPIDIQNALELYQSGDVDMVITGSEAERSPYFNMVEKSEEGMVKLVCADKKITRRQDSPIVYDIATVTYVANPQYILEENSIWAGNTKLSLVPKHRAIDIDTELDLIVARSLYNSNPEHYNFQL